MRPTVQITLCLLLLPLGCDSSNPEAATRHAQGVAASAARAAVPSPGGPVPEPGEVVKPDDGGLPGPGRPGEFTPAPSVATSTCVVAEDDDADHDDDDDDVKGNPGGPNLPGLEPGHPRDPGTADPGAIARSATARGAGARPPRGETRSARTGSTAIPGPGSITVDRGNDRWASTCASQLSGRCEDVCGSRAWDSEAANGGVCWQQSSDAEPGEALSLTTLECGCLCKAS